MRARGYASANVVMQVGAPAAVEAPGWFAWNGLANGPHEIAGGETSVTFEVVPGGVAVFIR